MRKFTLLFIFLGSFGLIHSQTCPTSGTTTVGTNPDTYYPGTQATVNTGATSITIGAASSGTTPIAIGDIVLIIQMQGAEISSANSDSYGNGVAGSNANGYLNNANHRAGTMEYAVATNAVPLGGGTLTIATGTTNSYSNSNFGSFGQYRYQVIRVPVYFNATLSANITAPAWNGTTGGVIAIEAKGNFSFAGFTIDASGRGFRGGGGGQLAGSGTGANTDYVTLASTPQNGSKGEGTAGTPRYLNDNGTLLDNGVANEGYPSGSFGRGAPGNAGGGGTDGDIFANSENSGGAGGGNGGAGGRGGDTWSSSLVIGGEPGAVFAQNSPARVVMGGGAGAGSTNNGTGSGAFGFSSSGAAGGGIVILIAKNISSAGTINVNGANADNSVLNDGSGGGGAGGSIIILTEGGYSNITALARGGTGGTNTGGGTPHGPGGGGGGGVIYATGTLNVASSVAGGAAGTTSGASNFGAAAGSNGTLVQNASPFAAAPNSNACLVLPTKLLSFTYAPQGQGLLLQWKVTNELNVKEYILEKSFDGRTFTSVGTVASQNIASGIKTYGYPDNAVNNTVIFYRLKVVDVDGKSVYSNIIVYKASYATDNVFAIFPNPVVNKTATVIIPQRLVNKAVTVRVIDTDGKMIYAKQQSSYTNTLNVNFPATAVRGIVMVQVLADGEVVYKEKVILQ